MNAPQKNPRVFVPTVPSRFDHTLRTWLPIVDMTAAKKFGDLVIMLPPDAARAGPGPCRQVLREKLIDLTLDDWIVCVGNPTLVGLTCAIASRITGGRLRMLQWDRMSANYYPIEVDA